MNNSTSITNPNSPHRSNDKMIETRVGRISYLNVDPIYYGLENGLRPPWVRLTAAPPASLNRLMAEDKLDISPVSTGAYARHSDQWLILPDLSISCHGPVMSVLLASNFPIKDLDGRRVLITSESGTAVLLLKLIFAIEGVHPRMHTGPVNMGEINDDAYDAVMIIGDKALAGNWGRQYQYRLDLGDVWYRLSGLPIVFAVWAVRRRYADAYPAQVQQTIVLFRESAHMGANRLDEIITLGAKRLNLDESILRAYFKAMEYDLDGKKQRALKTFFNGLSEHGLLEKAAPLTFFPIPKKRLTL